MHKCPVSLATTMADVEAKIFRSSKCLLCHTKVTQFMTSLDLESDNLAARVVDKMAEANPAKGQCPDKPLLPKADPLGGLFVKKVLKTHDCGKPMPQGESLTRDEVECVKMWAILAAGQ